MFENTHSNIVIQSRWMWRVRIDDFLSKFNAASACGNLGNSCESSGTWHGLSSPQIV